MTRETSPASIGELYAALESAHGFLETIAQAAVMEGNHPLSRSIEVFVSLQKRRLGLIPPGSESNYHLGEE